METTIGSGLRQSWANGRRMGQIDVLMEIMTVLSASTKNEWTEDMLYHGIKAVCDQYRATTDG